MWWLLDRGNGKELRNAEVLNFRKKKRFNELVK